MKLPKAAGSEADVFRPIASIWRWPLLVKLITTLCPQETSSCEHWHTNDGDGLKNAQALALAEALERKLGSGEVAAALCDPAIMSTAEPPIAAWFRSQGVDMLHEESVIDKQYVAKFTAFVRASGGFAIW